MSPESASPEKQGKTKLFPPDKYSPSEIEKKWQARWAADDLYRARDDDPRPKWYALTMFPYTSGDLHIGHWYAMAPSDVHARFKRMQGYNVLHPMGFDAFGLPAENAAIKRGIHPFKWTMDNIENMRRQLRTLGAVYDWSREAITCVPEYYRWNQWLFLQFYKNGLAYRAKAPANWCEGCKTVLANEQVISGACERCDGPVVQRDLEQWFFRITKYAEELLDFSGLVDWPEQVMVAQRNWIGRSEGVEISFGLDAPGVAEKELRVFTTRPDTVFGVTFMVLAPEHKLVPKLTTADRRAEVEAYVERARHTTEMERLAAEREKTGVFIGAYCVNRLNGERVPIFIADYALAWYGTGAVMGVPAHDERDFAFAKKYGLPIIVVIAPPDWRGEELKQAYIEPGTMVNSDPFNGLPSDKGWRAIADHMEQKRLGRRQITYRLRDWLISRQRYWGTPIPIVYCPKCGTAPVPEDNLPLVLPEDAEFRPTGESPLTYHKAFVNTACPQCGTAARRESDTMDTFVDSAWYHMRYASSHYDKGMVEPAASKKWLPVNQYTGGAEHATKHLLYARFIAKALRDLGVVRFSEPYLRLYCQGIILGEDHEKMSKSRGNVVNPDEFVSTLGADAIRCYLMFLGPWEQGGPWSTQGIMGLSRWLGRVWDIAARNPAELARDGAAPDTAAERELMHWTHKTIKRVSQDIEKFHFNTMIAAMMEYSNHLNRAWEARSVSPESWRKAVATLLLLLAPSAPHLAEELWERSGHAYSVHSQRWPQWDEALTAENVITLVVQVNGKVRDKLSAPASITKEEAERLALGSEKVKQHTAGKAIANVVYVPGKLVNVVVK
ncbi:MAG: leucine--tRNA ligase [Chloroflexi bacterium]|nr:leucine--tRNA ligase [Chloroflexota bacterium]